MSEVELNNKVLLSSLKSGITGAQNNAFLKKISEAGNNAAVDSQTPVDVYITFQTD